MGEAQRQAALRQGVGRGHQPADDRIAALAVEHLSRLQILFRGSDSVGAPSRGHTGGLVAQAHRSHGNTDFEPDHVPAFVQAGVAPRRIGLHAVLLEAALDVFGLRLEHDPHAEADVVRDGFSFFC